MPGLTAEQMRLATRLNEMLTADDWRGIVAQEHAVLALARDVRGAMAGAILRALGNAYQSLGGFSQAMERHTYLRFENAEYCILAPVRSPLQNSVI